MTAFICILVGFIIGAAISRLIFKEKPVGSLRVDQSDPDGGPYLFLELNRDGTDAIYKKKYICLTVNFKNYISHE